MRLEGEKEKTWRGLCLALRERFRSAGAFDPDRAARELTCCAAGKTREELVRDGWQSVPPEGEQKLACFAERYLSGEPLAYLLGEWEFYGLPLSIDRSVLIPRPDTEILAERAVAAAKAAGSPRVLDLCAGSGCIGLAIAQHVPGATVVLGEQDPGALAVCRGNIRRSSLDARVTVQQLDALHAPDSALGQFDLLVSNPPYIPAKEIDTLDASVRDYEPRLALDGGADGLDFYRSICSMWREVLRPGGGLLFEVGLGQAEAVAQLLQTSGFDGVQTYPDLGGILRVVSGVMPESE